MRQKNKIDDVIPPLYYNIQTMSSNSSDTNNNNNEKESYSIRLSGSDGRGKNCRHVVTIVSKETTFADLIHQTNDLFGSSKVDFWCGFPPSCISYPHPKSLVSDYISKNESVLVKCSDNNKKTTTKQKALPKKATLDNTTTASTTSTTRPKRKAAQQAMESFADTIRYQNELLSQQQKQSSSRKTTSKKAKTNAAAAAAAKAHSRKMEKIYPGGTRLGDSSTSSETNSTANNTTNDTHNNRYQQQEKRKKVLSLGNTKDDLTNTLLSSVGNTNSSSKVSLVIRRAMKNAVHQQYEANRATVRLASLHYRQKEDKKTKFIPSTHGTSMRVEYSKGLQGRGTYEETVDILSKETLQGVIQTVYQSSSNSRDEDDENEENYYESREMLRPLQMAQLSPRVFFFFFYHFPDNDTLEESLKQLVPNLDWNFLHRRTVMLSEKAKENQRQQQKDKQKQTNNDKQKEFETAQNAIQEVEDAMIQSSSSSQQLRQRAAQAAMKRFQQHQHKTIPKTWSFITPNEVDEEELKECIQSSIMEETKVKEYISILLEKCRIHNWRELANANIDELLLHFQDESIIESWMDIAQQNSLEEIMLEILEEDENDAILETLRNHANAGTPKDLALWESIPSLLLDQIQPHLSSSSTINVNQVQTWCQRARVTLDTCEWLNDYITPIS